MTTSNVTPRQYVSIGPAKKDAVLVFLIGSLGDTIFSLPSLKRVRELAPSARIYLLTNTPEDGGIKAASSVQLLDGTTLIDEYLEYPHRSGTLESHVRLITQIRRLRIRSGFYLVQRRSPLQKIRDRLFFWACGIGSMTGMLPIKSTHRPPSDSSTLWESEARRMFRTIGGDGGSVVASDFNLNLSKEERLSGKSWISNSGIGESFIVVSVGTKVSAKDWGEENWQRFLECLQDSLGNRPCGLAFIGSADERDRSDRLGKLWKGPIANFCGSTSPRVSGAILSYAQLFVGHDSGPMHLAASVGIPTVAIFSAREQPGIWFPIGQEGNVFYRNVPCRDCRLDVCTVNAKRCLTEIDPAEVAQRAAHLLDLAKAT